MNRRFDFTQLGGFPFSQNVLAFMQDSYRNAFASIAKFCGDKTIVEGVVIDGANVTAGLISHNGELIPFIAGTYSAGVVVEELSENLLFQDNVNRPVKFTKVAYCGSPSTFNFSELVRLSSQKEIWLPGDIKQVDCSGAYITANFDGTGLGINERKGWAICNGNNGTLDRRGRMSIAWDNRTTDPGSNPAWNTANQTMGAVRGAQQVQLSKDNLPPLTNSSNQQLFGLRVTGSNTNEGTDSTAGEPDIVVPHALSWSNLPFSIMNPVIVTLFIQKI